MASEKSTSPAGSSSLGLQNRLLEVAVVVGMDEETGLIPRKLNKFNGVAENLSLFECHFQGHILDIISGPQDETQSPLKEFGISRGWRQSLKQMSLKASREAKENQTKPKKTVQRSRSIRKMRNKANKREEVPVSTDFLRNLPCICLPGDSRVVSKPSNPTFHTTVLTDIGGYHHYAAVLTFFRPYYALPDEETVSNCWKLSEKVESLPSSTTSQSNQCHVPCCLCFVSKKPYFEVLKDCLSCFHKELGLSSRNSFRKLLEKYVTNLSLMICPPPHFNLCYTVSSLPIVLVPPDNPLKPNRIIDIDLRLPLFIFMKDPVVLLNVLACIMLEQRIVFLSESYAVLTLVVECLLHYIRPMEWHHQYIPILFSEIIGFVDCPGIFIMGCHSKHKMEIEKVENDLFLVDLDNCRIYTNSSSSFKTGNGLSGQFASQMPDFAVQSFLMRLSELRLHNSVLNLSSISPVSLEELRNTNLERRTSLNKKIQSTFMDLMINLFSSALRFIDHERHQFKYNEFLESIQPTNSPFYIKAVKTYMFRRFINQRMRQAPDEFSRIAEMRLRRRSALLIQQRRNQPRIRSMDVIGEMKAMPSFYKTVGAVGAGCNSHINQMLDGSERDPLFSSLNIEEDHFTFSRSFGENSSPSRRSSEPIPENTELRTSSDSTDGQRSITITLPSFPVQGTNFNTNHFYRRCIEVVNECWQKLSMDSKASRADASNSQTLFSASLRAGLLTLRGYYKVAEGSLAHGLEDLNAIAKENTNLFPEKTIEKILLSLNQQELATVKKQSFYKGPSADKSAGGRSFSTSSQSPSQYDYLFDENGVPLAPVAEEGFHHMLEKSDVTTDGKELSVLFQALAQSSNEIDPEIFSVFLQTWKQLKHECELAQNNLCAGIRMFQEGGTGKQVDDVSVDINKPIAFHPREHVLKVSATVSSNRGNGRIILTTRRVLFIAAGNNDCKTSIELQEILFIKTGKLKNFVSSTQALIIIYQNDSSSPLKVGLKAECELWLHLINEMKTGRILSREKRDQQQTTEAAAQNVIIADAFHSMIKDEGYMKLDDAMAWVIKLCKFKGMHDAGETMALSPETEEMLVMCMDPSPKESKKTGIQALIFSAAGIDEIPQVWVALGSGKIRLIDTTSWNLDPRPVKDWKSQPLCMCMVRKSELWIGADDGMIYVLLMETMKTARILNDHSKPIIAIAKTESDTIVSADKNGEIIVWNIEPISINHRFAVFSPQDELVSFFPFRSKFCCCSSTFLIICDSLGKTTQQFSLGEFASLSIGSNLTCCSWDGGNEVWAGDSRGAVYAWDCSLSNFQFAKNNSYGSSSHLTSTKSKVEQDLMPKFSGILHELHSNVAITCMVKNDVQIWLGNSNGEIIVLNTTSACQERALKAHNGPVTTLCKLESRYMISGSDDGKIMVWRQ